MDFIPPISERTDKELFNIFSNSKKWNPIASEQAYLELLNRNYSNKEIESKKNNNQHLIDKYDKRKLLQRKENAQQSYSKFEMLLIILGLPFRMILNYGFQVYWELDKFNYSKKIYQRIFLTIISILFWFMILNLLFKLNLIS